MERFGIELVLRGIILCLLTALTLVFLRRAAAAYRHLVCVLALCLLPVLPWAPQLLPPLRLLPANTTGRAWIPFLDAGRPPIIAPVAETPAGVQNPPQPLPQTEPTPTQQGGQQGGRLPAPVPQQKVPSIATILLLALWAIGAVLLLLRLALALIRLRGLEVRSQPATLADVALRTSDEVATPLTWGIWNPIIVLPSALLSADRAACESALRHEQAHIARGDWAWNLLAEIVCAVCWFQPGAWWLRSRMRLESERACDDRVLLSGIAGPDYATHLLRIARSACAPEVAPALAQRGGMDERMRHILDNSRPRHAHPGWLTASTLFSLSLLSLAILRIAVRPAAAQIITEIIPSGGESLPSQSSPNQDTPITASGQSSDAPAATPSNSPSSPPGRISPPSGPSRNRTLIGLIGTVTAVCFSPDNKSLVTGGADGTAHIWDTATGQARRTLKGGTARISQVLYSPDGQFIFVGCSDGAIHTWSAASGEKLQTLVGPGAGVCALDCSQEGTKLVAGYESGTIIIWNPVTGKNMGTDSGGNRLLSVAISPDGTTAAAGYSSGYFVVWDVLTRERLFAEETPQRTAVTGLHFDIQGYLYTWHSADVEDTRTTPARTVPAIALTIRGVRPRRIVSRLTFPWPSNTIRQVVSYNNLAMVFGLSEGRVILNNLQDGPVTITAHEGFVDTIAISPDGSLGATSGIRRGKWEVKIWDMKAYKR